MKKLLVLFLALTVVPVAGAQPFPAVPVTPEQPVSEPVLSAAADAQMATRIATNGDLTLVVWMDNRAGTSATYAARMDAAGKVLDPLGVRIAGGQFADAVVWSGNTFIVVFGRTLVFVTADMTMTQKTIDLPPTYSFAAATSASPPRFLYLEPILGIANAAVVNTDGNVIGRRPFWSNPPNWLNGTRIAAGNETGFLVLREIRENLTGNGRRIIAERIDDNANPIGSNDALLPVNVISGAEGLAGGEDGFLFVAQSFDDGRVIGYALDGSGVYRGGMRILASATGGVRYLGSYKPTVLRESDGYLVVWHTSYLNGTSAERVGEVSDAGAIDVRDMVQWAGITFDMAVTSALGRRFVATTVSRLGVSSGLDVFARELSAGDPHLVALSATMQTNVQMAAGANGYAITWAEAGPDNAARLYLRRFSPAGVPQDAAPVEIQAFPFDPLWHFSLRAKIVSNGAIYLTGWSTAQGFMIRRLDAQSGAWIDPRPILLPKQNDADLATNGTEAMAVSFGSCEDAGMEPCLYATRIPMSGAPPAAAVRSFHAAPSSAGPVIASNGASYLVAWTDPVLCNFLCAPKPADVYAARLRADGQSMETVLERPTTLRLTNGTSYSSAPSVAFAGGNYLVVWNDGVVRGTRITEAGSLLDRDADGNGVVLAGDAVAARAIAADGRFGLITAKQQQLSSAGPTHVTWEGVVFAPGTSLSAVGALPRTAFLDLPNASHNTIAPVFRNGLLALGYSRVGDSSAGDVSRVFFRAFVELARRRPIQH